MDCVDLEMRAVSAIYLVELLSRWSVFSIAGRCCLPPVCSLIWLPRGLDDQLAFF